MSARGLRRAWTVRPPERLVAAAGYLPSFIDRRPWLAIGLSALAATMLLAAFAVHLLLIDDIGPRVGVDYRQYLAATNSWLAGDGFYPQWQLIGPYGIPRDVFDPAYLPVLYPPPALLLFLPFTLSPALAVAWWAIPVVVVAVHVLRCRPAPWTWPILTLSVLSGDTVWLTISGNPVLWTTLALALGTRYAWPSVLVLLKPTLSPLALVGAWRRSWWVALAATLLVSLAFAPMWPDYFTALGNVVGSSVAYSANNVPMMVIPLVAWLGRRTLPARAAQPERVVDVAVGRAVEQHRDEPGARVGHGERVDARQ